MSTVDKAAKLWSCNGLRVGVRDLARIDVHVDRGKGITVRRAVTAKEG